MTHKWIKIDVDPIEWNARYFNFFCCHTCNVIMAKLKSEYIDDEVSKHPDSISVAYYLHHNIIYSSKDICAKCGLSCDEVIMKDVLE